MRDKLVEELFTEFKQEGALDINDTAFLFAHTKVLEDKLSAIEEACCEVENDWAPEHPPYAAQELIERIRDITK